MKLRVLPYLFSDKISAQSEDLWNVSYRRASFYS